MLAAMTLALLGAWEGESVIWLEQWQAAEKGVTIPHETEYTVWLWLEENGTVTIGKHAMDTARKKDAGYGWSRAGTERFTAGHHPVSFSGPVAALALSTDPDFNPAAAMADMRVFNQPQSVDDPRTRIDRDTNTLFTMTRFDSREDWEAFAGDLCRRILIANGLFPLPERTPLNPHVETAAEHDGYIVERVRIEAYPGFYVTGNVYRPKGDGPFPAIACPHGHWGEGRLANDDRGSVPARCITFARMGAVAFSYDMLGYNDSLQLDHGLAKAGGADISGDARRLTLYGIHPFALQLWSSVRVLDYLQSLDYVDPERLACTGASGGGTQTFALTAIDDRVDVAAPVNMISHSMQGGCLCENAPLLRFDASNMEIGALAAPRPLVLVSASGDWTRATPLVEYPAIRSIYALYDAADRLENHHFQAGHNYNEASREAVYRFFGKWFLKQPGKYAGYEEPEYEMDPAEKLRVFPEGTLPESAPSGKQILDELVERNREKWQRLLPASPDGLGAFHEMARPALATVFGTREVTGAPASARLVEAVQRETHTLWRLVVEQPATGGKTPALLYMPKGTPPEGAVVIAHGRGKAALAPLDGEGPGSLVQALLDQNRAVMAIDLFLTGEHHDPTARAKRQTKSYPDTFLPTVDAYRVQDILTACAFLRHGPLPEAEISVIGIENGGMPALFAAALDTAINATVVDANGFNAGDDNAWLEDFYAPCLRAVGDASTAACLVAPRPLTVFNTGPETGWPPVAGASQKAAPDTLRITAGALAQSELVAAAIP